MTSRLHDNYLNLINLEKQLLVRYETYIGPSFRQGMICHPCWSDSKVIRRWSRVRTCDFESCLPLRNTRLVQDWKEIAALTMINLKSLLRLSSHRLPLRRSYQQPFRTSGPSVFNFFSSCKISHSNSYLKACSAHNGWHWIWFKMNVISSTFLCNPAIFIAVDFFIVDFHTMRLRSALIHVKDIVELQPILLICRPICWLSSRFLLLHSFCCCADLYTHSCIAIFARPTEFVDGSSFHGHSGLPHFKICELFSITYSCKSKDWMRTYRLISADGKTHLYGPNIQRNHKKYGNQQNSKVSTSRFSWCWFNSSDAITFISHAL